MVSKNRKSATVRYNAKIFFLQDRNQEKLDISTTYKLKVSFLFDIVQLY